MKFYMNNSDQGYLAFKDAWLKCKEQLSVGKQLEVEIKYQSRNNEQNSKYHAMIGDIAKQASHLGSKWDSESWKRLLVQEFCKETGLGGGKVIPNLSGDGICQLGHQTRNFTKEQASEFVEWLHAWGAENGITYTEKT